MSSGALFGNNASRSTSKNLVEFKAGKMTMKGNVVYPDTRKGQLYVYQSDDSLMHFCWKDRTTGVVEDDLIIFPDDCEFKHVPQCKTGRVYLLRFKSSSKKLFVWLQDLKTDKDEENCRKINEVLNNPPAPGSQRNEGDIQNLLNNMSQQQLMQLFGGVGRIGSLGSLDSILGTMNRPYTLQTIMSSPRNAMRNVARASSPLAYSSEFESHSIPESQCTADGHSTSDSSRKTDSQSASKTQGKSESQGSSKSAEKSESQTTSESNNESESNRRTSATPVTTSGKSIPQSVVAAELAYYFPDAFTGMSHLYHTMSTYLPPGDNLLTTISTTQFVEAVSMFWSALQTGQTGPIIRQFGFGPEVINAATTGNVEQFINALESEAKTGQEQPQDGQKDKDAKQSSPATKPDKKDDDDEGMALD